MMQETSKRRFWIVGGNLMVMVVYNLLCKLIDSKDGWNAVAVFVLIQSACCFITGLVSVFVAEQRKMAGSWFLSSLLVLLIGVSTCCNLFRVSI